MTPKDLAAYYPLIIGLVCLIAWFVRLEAKVHHLEENHKDHKLDTKEIHKTNSEKIDKVNDNLIICLQSLSKIEGKLEITQGRNNEDS